MSDGDIARAAFTKVFAGGLDRDLRERERGGGFWPEHHRLRLEDMTYRVVAARDEVEVAVDEEHGCGRLDIQRTLSRLTGALRGPSPKTEFSQIEGRDGSCVSV